MSQDEIEAHEAAMQRVVEDEKKEQEEITDFKSVTRRIELSRILVIR